MFTAEENSLFRRELDAQCGIKMFVTLLKHFGALNTTIDKVKREVIDGNYKGYGMGVTFLDPELEAYRRDMMEIRK